jgi:hypothetical protein
VLEVLMSYLRDRRYAVGIIAILAVVVYFVTR